MLYRRILPCILRLRYVYAITLAGEPTRSTVVSPAISFAFTPTLSLSGLVLGSLASAALRFRPPSVNVRHPPHPHHASLPLCLPPSFGFGKPRDARIDARIVPVSRCPLRIPTLSFAANRRYTRGQSGYSERAAPTAATATETD